MTLLFAAYAGFASLSPLAFALRWSRRLKRAKTDERTKFDGVIPFRHRVAGSDTTRPREQPFRGFVVLRL